MEVERVRNCSFNLCANFLLHIDTRILTSHFSKILGLQFYGCGNISISEALGYVCIVADSNIVRISWDTEEQK